MLELILDPGVWLYVAIGVSLGVLFGSLPGFTATMGLAILTPLTFWLPTDRALAMLFGVLNAAIFSGGVPAILINTPGTPASIAATWDGYPLGQQGRAGLALGVNALAAFASQAASIAVFAVAAAPLAAFALRFGPAEYFAVAVLGISTMVGLSSESAVKGFLMGALGLALALVGLDPILAYPRFTFGSADFVEGISFIPVMVGLFGVAEVLLQVYDHAPHLSRPIVALGRLLPTRDEIRAILPAGVIGTAIGVWIGVMPAAGGDVGSVLAWDQSRRWSKAPEQFGRGSLEGLTASVTGANGGIGGALITTFTLGLPGDSASAVLIGALLIHGLQPGPLLFRHHPEFMTQIVVLLTMATLLTLAVGLAGARPLAMILKVRDTLLWPIVLLVCAVGSYALNTSVVDVWVMLTAGVAGFVLRRAGFPMGPLVLALILGPMAESNFRRALVVSQGSLAIFVERPIALAILLLTFVSVAWPVVRGWLRPGGQRG